MFTLIKCILGGALVGGGAYLQQKHKNKDLYNFIYGAEFVVAGLIIVFTA